MQTSAKKNFYDLEQLRNEVFSGLLSKAYIYALVKQEKIKSVRIGKRILISAAEAERLVREGV
ncbi:MAG: hypothetical protein H6Q69_1687 [Firmicutes bacterium]|nr:hypothetical protein [Bacillota bacterium]